MKKLIAIALVISMCLCGCADVAKTPADSTEPTTKLSESTVRTTTLREEPEQEFVQPLLAMLPIEEQIWLPRDEELVQAQEELERYELAMYLVMRPWMNLIVDNYDYLQDAKDRMLFAFELARWDPATMAESGNGSVSITEDVFRNYYHTLFAEEPDISLLDGFKALYGVFKLQDAKIYLNWYGDGLQDIPPVLKNPMMEYDEARDIYLLRVAMLYAQELYTGEDSMQYYRSSGEYWQFAGAEITEYPPSCELGNLIFELKKNNGKYHIMSAKMEPIQLSFDEMTLAELLSDGLPLSESMRQERIARQLRNYYTETFCSLFLNQSWEIDINTGVNFLNDAVGKAKFAWFQIIFGEQQGTLEVLWDATPEGVETTGAAAIKQEDFRQCFIELFGEEPNWNELDGEALYPGIKMTIKDGYVYGGFPSGAINFFNFRNVSVLHDMEIGECVITAEMYDEADEELFYGTIDIKLEMNDSGYYFRAIDFRGDGESGKAEAE